MNIAFQQVFRCLSDKMLEVAQMSNLCANSSFSLPRAGSGEYCALDSFVDFGAMFPHLSFLPAALHAAQRAGT